jgi:hypothetical protein
MGVLSPPSCCERVSNVPGFFTSREHLLPTPRADEEERGQNRGGGGVRTAPMIFRPSSCFRINTMTLCMNCLFSVKPPSQDSEPSARGRVGGGARGATGMSHRSNDPAALVLLHD